MCPVVPRPAYLWLVIQHDSTRCLLQPVTRTYPSNAHTQKTTIKTVTKYEVHSAGVNYCITSICSVLGSVFWCIFFYMAHRHWYLNPQPSARHQPKLQDLGHEACVSHGVPVFFPAYADSKLSCLVRDACVCVCVWTTLPTAHCRNSRV